MMYSIDAGTGALTSIGYVLTGTTPKALTVIAQ
jgi:hypothetical protein